MNSNVNGSIFESKDLMKKTKADKLMYQCFESEESRNAKNKDTKLQDKNIKEYHNLTSKILKKGILSTKDSSHLATMFSDAATNCNPKNKDIDGLYDSLLDISIKQSKVKKTK